MSLARHCDGHDCDTHEGGNGGPVYDWLEVRATYGPTLHFCGWDCAIKYGARFDAPEVVELG